MYFHGAIISDKFCRACSAADLVIVEGNIITYENSKMIVAVVERNIENDVGLVWLLDNSMTTFQEVNLADGLMMGYKIDDEVQNVPESNYPLLTCLVENRIHLKLSLPPYILSQKWERGINFHENFSSFVELRGNSALEDRVYLHGVIFKKGKYFTALSAQKIGLAIGSVVRLRQDNRILNVVLITTIFNAPEIWLCKDTTCLEVEVYSVHEIQDVIDSAISSSMFTKDYASVFDGDHRWYACD
jgi:hypothetical protein